VERRISSGPAHDIAPIPNLAPQTGAGGPNPPPLGSELLRRLGPKPLGGDPQGRREPLLGFAWEWSALAWTGREAGGSRVRCLIHGQGREQIERT